MRMKTETTTVSKTDEFSRMLVFSIACVVSIELLRSANGSLPVVSVVAGRIGTVCVCWPVVSLVGLSSEFVDTLLQLIGVTKAALVVLVVVGNSKYLSSCCCAGDVNSVCDCHNTYGTGDSQHRTNNHSCTSYASGSG